MYSDRVVELTFRAAGKVTLGSGYLISPRHILTARHVLGDNPKLKDACVSRQLMSSAAARSGDLNAPRPAAESGKVCWLPHPSVELDVAVIELDRAVDIDSPSPSFGLMPTEALDAQSCRCAGFPAAAGNDSRIIHGNLTFVPTSSRCDLDIIWTTTPENWLDWAGLSGAVVFCGKHALAVVRTVRRDWRGGLLSATPLQLLLQEPTFQEYWQSGGLKVIVPQSLGPYSPTPPHVRRLRELRQHYLGSGADRPMFVGRESQVRALNDWLLDDKAPTCFFLGGAAALGKTSLVLNWLGDPQADKHSYLVAFLPISVRFGTNSPDLFWSMAAARLAQLAGLEFERPSSQLSDIYLSVSLDALDRLQDQGRPLLLVIDALDEAISWEIDQRLFASSRPKVRVLVTARASGTVAVDRWLQKVGWRRGRQTAVLELLPLDRSAVLQAVRELSKRRGGLSAEAVALGEEIWRLSLGDPLPLGYYLDDLINALDDPNIDVLTLLADAHAGFDNYFAHWVSVQKPYWQEDDGRVDLLDGLLALLACAHGPITTYDIEHLLAHTVGLKTLLSRTRLQALNRFVIETADGWTLAHPRLQSVLLDEFLPEGGWASRARTAFLEWAKEVCRLPETAGSRYLSRYGSLHLTAFDATSQDVMLLASEPWARQSLTSDESGLQLAMDLQAASRAISLKAASGEPLLGWQWSIFLMEASVVSRAHLEPELLAAFVRHGLARQDSTIRRFDLMPARDRAIGFALLADGVSTPKQEDLLAESSASIAVIKDFEQRNLAWIQVLRVAPGTVFGDKAEKALLHELDDAGSMYYWLTAVDRMAPLVSLEVQKKLLHCTFSQVQSHREWRYLDCLLPHLRQELFDEAVILANIISQQSDWTGNLWNDKHTSRLSSIDEAALPYLFPALNSNEKNSCWRRVHELVKSDKYLSTSAERLVDVVPWLQAEGRDDEVEKQLEMLYRESQNDYIAALELTRFARAIGPGRYSKRAVELAMQSVIKRFQTSTRDCSFDFVVDLLDEEGIEECYQLALRADPEARRKALAQLASRLSTSQLEHVQRLELQIGDRIEVATARLALQLRDHTDFDGSRTMEAAHELHNACPGALSEPAALVLAPLMTSEQQSRIGPLSKWLAGGADSLLIAHPEGASPTELWEAIQRQKYAGAQYFHLIENYTYLRQVVPIEIVTHAIDMYIGGDSYATASAAIDLLPNEVAALLRARLEVRVKGNGLDTYSLVEGARVLALRGPDYERWKKLAFSAFGGKPEAPEVLVPLLELCHPTERQAHLEVIRRSCVADTFLGLRPLIKLMPLLTPNEARSFVEPWLAAVRQQSLEAPDWLASQPPIPQPFANATMSVMQELMKGATRTSILRFLAAWAVPIGQTYGTSVLRELISGVYAAGRVFE